MVVVKKIRGQEGRNDREVETMTSSNIYEHNDSLRTKKPKLDTIVLVSLGSKTGRLHEKQETLFIKENREMVLIGFSKPFFSKEGLIQ